MNFIEVSGISKKLQDQPILKDINFVQPQFQQLAIAGATGSGKSTLLKIISGLIQTDEGMVRFNGNRVKGPLEVLLPGHPGIAYLSQHFELRNNFRVEEILERDNKLVDEDAMHVYEVCRITHLFKRKNDQISGGERQRVALARLLTTAPQLLVLDEPFSNLDMIHKQQLKDVIADIASELSITCILTSHDPLDVLSWADRILIMRAGEIVQDGTPQEVYLKPADDYCAALFGKFNKVSLKGKTKFIRPENIVLTKGKGIPANVIKVKYFGSHEEALLDTGKEQLLASFHAGTVKQGEEVTIKII
ncbi:ABC-type sugar transport system, ATPase component [Chitinophaga jiangningensis]|uniref:ABC-type sugar transport system, ATPase component n=1 Tax=Chitinophaga jiangningensis TaxID=1419482 RepID=A0A1M7LTT9_9BACT|nr:ABC transporter ATP-binding protein [Chitinophaga jiangningensis]SHM81588.1 ABC-type sugar transport system, ATPase component [Chitinophaga jiangningensis]